MKLFHYLSTLTVLILVSFGPSLSSSQTWEIISGNLSVESGEIVHFLMGKSELYGTKAELVPCSNELTIELSKELLIGSIISFQLINYINSTHKLNFWFNNNLYSVIEQNVELETVELDGIVGAFDFFVLPVGGNLTMKLKYIRNIHEGDVKNTPYFEVNVEAINSQNIPCNIEEGSVVFGSTSITIVKEAKGNLFREYSDVFFMMVIFIFFIVAAITIYRLLRSEIRKLKI